MPSASRVVLDLVPAANSCDCVPGQGSCLQMRLIATLCVFLFACGSGGGGSSSPTDAQHHDDALDGDDASVTSCGTCDTPPTACHARTGTCEDSVCEYAFVEEASCDDGNACTVADTCSNGGCTGTPMVCGTPPANVCLNATQLKTFDQVGGCNGGLCTYASQVITCGAGGCSNGACVTDPCASVTCNSPPSGCYAATGTCSNGSCTYPYANGASCNDSNACTSADSCQSGVCFGVPKACNTPPPSVCENASTLKVYSSAGSCGSGTCSYSYGYATCAGGCANDQCNGTGWTIMNSNVTVFLKAVWASSATSAWAGGSGGTLVYYNGAQWQVRPSGVASEIVAIHGTAANNVFAQTQSELLYFDGSSWTTIASMPQFAIASIFAIGSKDVLAYGWTSTSNPTLLRFQYLGGTWQQTTIKQGEFRRPNYGYRMWAESLTSVYTPGGNHWDGMNITVLGQATYLARGPGRMWKAGSLLLGQDYQNGTTTVYRYDTGTAKWVPFSTGFAGTHEDLHGTSDTRIFLVGTTFTGNTPIGHVLFYDGVGWTSAALPAGVGRLRSVWSLPTGEVFAVGDAGLILKGP